MNDPGIESGVATPLTRLLKRITAPNPGMMTGAGTNTYLIGEESVAVIDPGPADDQHIQAVLAAGGDRIRWLLITHTHPDHSPAAAILKSATGAEVLGRPPPDTPSQDRDFSPDRIVEDGEVLRTAEFSLRALHTPGHASNHLCFLYEDEQILFTGDHIKQDSTVVIAPPDGNMTIYLQTLARLLELPLKGLAPGHGMFMDNPREVMEALVAHRLMRERKVWAALWKAENATDEELLPEVYDDVPAFLHRVAIQSLRAHLLKLLDDGRVRRQGDRWLRHLPLESG
jgi:glyoxylase-like metal-dependent hydrolase (beta-lactamase superfamily II)